MDNKRIKNALWGANANAGGDCVHRGIILGLLAGAASDEIPNELKMGLAEYNSLKQEIEDFIQVIKEHTI